MSELHDRIAEAYQQAVLKDVAYMRSLGLTTTALRSVLNDYENAEISFDKLLNLVRAAARVMADEERTQADQALIEAGCAATGAKPTTHVDGVTMYRYRDPDGTVYEVAEHDIRIAGIAANAGRFDLESWGIYADGAIVGGWSLPPSIIALVLPWSDAHLPRPSPAPLRVADDALPSALSRPAPAPLSPRQFATVTPR